MDTNKLQAIAVKCAYGKPFGAYVTSRFFSGGFGFVTDIEAAAWVSTQLDRTKTEGYRNDFSAAAVGVDGKPVMLVS